MRLTLTIFHILTFTLLFPCSLTLTLPRSVDKRNPHAIANITRFYDRDSAEMTKRSGTKYVLMHHVGSIP